MKSTGREKFLQAKDSSPLGLIYRDAMNYAELKFPRDTLLIKVPGHKTPVWRIIAVSVSSYIKPSRDRISGGQRNDYFSKMFGDEFPGAFVYFL